MELRKTDSNQNRLASLLKGVAAVPVAGVLLLFSGCQSVDQQATYAPTGASQYPAGENQATQRAYSPVDSQGNSLASIGSAFQHAVEPDPDPSSAPTITAKCAILVNNRGKVLYEKNADMRVPVASTQKLLLGILIEERGGLNQTMTIADSDTWAEPTKMGIKAGDTYTRADLLRAVLVRSSNDIARALARDHSGSESAFAAAMNARARQLGMYNSYFTNSNGLPSPPGQYSTCRDLVTLVQAAQGKPFIRDAIRTKALVFRFSNGTTQTVYNTNQVLRSFPYCTGAKTGYTNAAGRCLVSTASYNGKSVTAVILGSKSPNVWTESEALLKYGLGM